MTRSFRPWLWVLLVVPVAFGFLRLRFDVDVLNLLPGDLPVVQGLIFPREMTLIGKQAIRHWRE